ncbi:MAG TPA: GIY-YIG nuclease family protein [Herpetosiphonaceae bacterium]
MATIPRRSGVYQILCIANDKIYVGSAVNLAGRWKHHCWELRRGRHFNRHLQNAWNKYGGDNFRFSILELVPRDELHTAEQKWIDQTGCLETEIGFNISVMAAHPNPVNIRVWEGFIDPDGNEVIIENLHKFCRENGLSVSSMEKLTRPNGKARSIKGWSHKNSLKNQARIQVWDGFIDPSGNPVIIRNLFAFCRENGLNDGSMYDVAKGKSYSYKGWTYNNDRKNKRTKTYTGFINPEGQRLTITNLRAFCRETGLDRTKLFKLINGTIDQYKGWIWREESDDTSAE